MLDSLLDRHEFLVLDGALATELEARGHDLSDPLWSARVLVEEPEAIGQLHADYLEAGADILTTASYQATFEGLAGRGLAPEEARGVFRDSVRLAVEARDALPREPGRAEPLVAASIGPYGAFLHDGSEYRGDYPLDQGELMAFHQERFACLAGAGADLLACETIPCLAEVRALCGLVEEHPGIRAWMSFCCRDGEHLSSGEPVIEAVRVSDGTPGVVAVGVNCTAPQWIETLVGAIRGGTARPIVVYPNSGEGWDPVRRCWTAADGVGFEPDLPRRWIDAGARIVGGCCRTGPGLTRRLAALRAR